MAWFRRQKKGIQTNTQDKKDTPEGLWHKTPSGKIVDNDELIDNNFVSPEDNFHLRIGSIEYFKILFDNNEYEVLFDNLISADPLKFVDLNLLLYLFLKYLHQINMGSDRNHHLAIDFLN